MNEKTIKRNKFTKNTKTREKWMKKYFEKKPKNNREQNKTIIKYTRSSEKLKKHT